MMCLENIMWFLEVTKKKRETSIMLYFFHSKKNDIFLKDCNTTLRKTLKGKSFRVQNIKGDQNTLCRPGDYMQSGSTFLLLPFNP